MRIPLPPDLPADPAAAYRAGWRDGRRSFSSRGGARTSEAKAAAARANGAKGGRPLKSVPDAN
jgi:hypothetical protein